jgi:signal peptidase I
MRFGFWKLFCTAIALMVTLYLLNPLGVASRDPRLRFLGIAPFAIPGNSMNPTLKVGDHIIASVWPYRLDEPQRGDMVVFLHPRTPDIKYVKRIIGLPGERVALRGGNVFINGKALDEPYVLDRAEERKPETTEMTERLISEGEFFMLGDNRNNSYDSRYWGQVPRSHFLGKASEAL